jgi:hypothetical protein
MNFGDLEKSALALNELYEQLEAKKYGASGRPKSLRSVS